MTVRVVLADDQTVVREGLRSMLGLIDGIEVVGVAATAEEALELVTDTEPDVLLTDLRMPGIGGIEGIHRLRSGGSRTQAVALTTYDDAATIVEALSAGALGFLNKDADPETIATAIRAAAQGRSLLDATATTAMLQAAGAATAGATPTPDTIPDGLTQREIDVLRLVAAGLANNQIARELFVSVSTVKTHINHLLAKTSSNGRAGLVRYAYEHGIAGS
jgi:DNA-binding NarL/FixJ family response regulator